MWAKGRVGVNRLRLVRENLGTILAQIPKLEPQIPPISQILRRLLGMCLPHPLSPAFGFCLAAMSNQSSALAGKGLKHRCSDLA